MLRALADPLRWQIVHLLATEALCTCHLVEETGASQTNISNHLRILRRAGIVEPRPHGRYTYYRLSPDVLRTLGDDLAGLAAVAERAEGANARRACP